MKSRAVRTPIEPSKLVPPLEIFLQGLSGGVELELAQMRLPDRFLPQISIARLH